MADKPLTGGDKPRPYRQNLTQQVGAGFIPARESAWLGNDFHLEIAQFRSYNRLKFQPLRHEGTKKLEVNYDHRINH